MKKKTQKRNKNVQPQTNTLQQVTLKTRNSSIIIKLLKAIFFMEKRSFQNKEGHTMYLLL